MPGLSCRWIGTSEDTGSSRSVRCEQEVSWYWRWGDVPTGLVAGRVSDVLSMPPGSIAPRLLSSRDARLDLSPEALAVAESATEPEKGA
jgi:hypothetical protein